MLMNKVEFLEKPVFFLVRPETYWVMCYVYLLKTFFYICKYLGPDKPSLFYFIQFLNLFNFQIDISFHVEMRQATQIILI